MSKHAMETILYRLANEPDTVARFKQSADDFLSGFNLTAEECRSLRDMNVEEMAAVPLNWMLMMGAFEAVHGRASRGQYLQRIGSHSTRRG